MTDGTQGPGRRFVPSGVDAQSWIGFEHRIQERRFNALVETIRSAVARHDGVTARVAFNEARELRPGAPELNALAARVALLSTAAPPSAASPHIWYRALSAVAMFLVGIGLVIGIEAIHPTAGQPSRAIVSAARSGLATPPAIVVDTPPAVADAPDVSPLPDPPKAQEPVVDGPAVIESRREEPVGTAGVSRASKADAGPAAAPNRATFRPTVEPEAVSQARREVPDDYVTPSTRSENRPGYTEVTSPAPPVAASVMPQPVSITAPPPVLAAAPAAVTPSSVAVRGDSNRVAQVLNQYARAYGRLDSVAARAVWPTVDERALSRAFASLESQEVSFDACDIDVKGDLASATCRGTASYVGKVGSRQARTEPRQWNFELKLHGDDWKIERAEARQASR